jgi:hypothetical protein
MPGWDEASVDELLADPIVRDLMAADGVDPSELRVLLYGIQRTLNCYAATSGQPTSLARFAKRHGTAGAVRPIVRTNHDRPDARRSPIALADFSRLSTAPLCSPFGSQMRCAARS